MSNPLEILGVEALVCTLMGPKNEAKKFQGKCLAHMSLLFCSSHSKSETRSPKVLNHVQPLLIVTGC